MSTEGFLIVAPPANPGGSSSAILFDSTYSLHGGTPVLNTQGPFRRLGRYKRATVTIFVDQNVTFFARALGNGSTSWRTYNGGGSGETVTASTFFERDVFLLGEDWQLYISTGTAPTVWEVSLRLRKDPALAQ